MKGSLAVCLAAAAAGCAPVFSDLQSARVARPGEVEVTPSAWTVHFAKFGGRWPPSPSERV